MNAAPAETSPPKWTRTRWLTLITFVFAAHVTLVFLFGTNMKIFPRIAKNVPTLKIAGESELFALNDPTLFVLPHQHDFSSAIQLQMSVDLQPSFRWLEPPRLLSLSDDELGSTFNDFTRTNYFADSRFDFKPPPELSELFLPVQPVLPQISTFQIQGDLVQRRLLDEIHLPSLPYNDVLAQAKVQALVGTDGRAISVVLLESSGWNDADQHAVELARSLRFSSAPRMTFGQLIFNWRTVPLSTTNAPVNLQ